MSIIGPLPNNIQNGQVIDAIPVMNNFNWIVAQVNANVGSITPPNSSSIATFVPTANVGGTGNAITLAPVPAITSYAQGQSFRFHAIAANTGAVTVATSGLAVRSLVSASGAALTGGEIVSGGIYDISDTGAAYQLVNSAQGTGLLTWTPVLRFGGASVGIAYSNQSGNYIKVGNIVYFDLGITLTSKGSSTGSATIAGLPYTANALSVTSTIVTSVSTITFTTDPHAAVSVGTNVLLMYENVSGAPPAGWTDTNFANTSGISIGGFYSV